jgi:beta-galactosidase
VVQGGKGNRYVREYGDWGFGGNESTSRQRRGSGEDAMLHQAWNFAWDRNRCLSDEGSSGAGYWGFVDYNRGAPGIETSGVMDLYRLPKFAYYWSQSQRDPEVTVNGIGGPMLFLANYWDARNSLTKVVCFSNCEEVELFINGKSFGKRKPDDGPDVNYNDLTKAGYGGRGSGGFPWSGGCQKHLAQPAFTFSDVPYEPGELKAVAYMKQSPVAQQTVQTPKNPVKTAVWFDLQGVAATTNDVVLVRASLLDRNNTVVPTDSSPVTFRVTSGPGELIGTNPINAEAGIATILLRTTGVKGAITVSAAAENVTREGTGAISTRDP